MDSARPIKGLILVMTCAIAISACSRSRSEPAPAGTDEMSPVSAAAETDTRKYLLERVDEAAVVQVYADDMWEWNGATWTKVTPVNTPPARENGQMAYDPTLDRIVMYAGYGGYFLSDLWILNANNTWSPRPEVVVGGRKQRAARRARTDGRADAEAPGGALGFAPRGPQIAQDHHVEGRPLLG